MKTPARLAMALAICAATAANSAADDPYVESAGTSGIDTGCYLTPNSRLEIDFALTTTTGAAQWRVFGSDSVNTSLKAEFYVTGSATWGAIVGNGVDDQQALWLSDGTDFIPADTERHRAVFDIPGDSLSFMTAGETVWTRATGLASFTKDATMPVTLFARYSSAAMTAFSERSKARIYGLRIYESGALAHDFEPCLKDGLAGFRDRVTGDFVTNGGAFTSFSAGGDYATYESPYVATPAGNSACYIDTEYQATSNTCFALDCAPIGEWGAGMSLFYGYGTRPFYGYVTADGYGTQNESAWNTGVVPLASLAQGLRRTLVLDNFNRKSYSLVAGVTNGTVKALSQSTEKCPGNTVTVKIASNHGGTGNFTSMKIYGCKIYEEGVLVRDFSPCAIGPSQDGSAIVGLQDSITGAFATYPAATSANRLACGGEKFPASAPYVETLRSANRYIDTGYSVTANTKVALDYSPTEAKASGDTWYFFGAQGTKRFVALIQDKGFGFSNDSWNHLNLGFASEGALANVRRTIILDNPAAKGVVETLGVTNINRTVDSAVGKDYGTKSLKISTLADANGHFASIRVYGCKIWEKENGEYVLKRDYVPAVENGLAGLRDILPGGVFKPGATSATTPITYGGVFTPTVTPAAATVKHGETATLTASAPGAASYRWLKNGVAVSGGTNGTLAATYNGAGVVDSYQAIAVYAIDAATAESEPSAPATVEGVASATVLVIR